MNRLAWAASERDADMLYATRFLAPDPFLWFEARGKRVVVVSELEVDRARREAPADEVIGFPEVAGRLRKRLGRAPRSSEICAAVLKRHGVRRAFVGTGFPFGMARALAKLGVRVEPREGGLFPEREIKTAAEVREVRAGLRVAADLVKRAADLIHRARPRRGGRLWLGGAPLTSERVQGEVRMEAARRGYESPHPIVAGGAQACDPHERGRGPLRANDLIILDIFPRSLASGYHGDLTRTVVKGRASEAQRKLHDAVKRGQALALGLVRAGADGGRIHARVQAFFDSLGYATGVKGGRHEGFFHGTGHGLGLEVHEAPRISRVPQRLRAGHVVTVEPGLYYAAIGGVRIEDVVLVRKGGAEHLSRCSVPLEI
jgi:Xaa-Pro aminopeptidase